MVERVNDSPNAEQIAYWNGKGGQHWTQRQDILDAILAPISATIIERAAASRGEHVVDVGCGCGETTLDLAKRVGPTGHVLGIDISAPMLERARERAAIDAPLTFINADATIHPFETGQTDLVFSRFGVMFFADPAASFTNLRTSLRSGGRLTFVCWREPRLNPWLITPLHAVYRHVPKPPDKGPDDPGPFAFSNQARVHRILDQAGFRSITMSPQDYTLDLALGRGLDAAVATALDIGPASRLLNEQSPEIKAAAALSIREVLATVQVGQTIPLGAAVWIVTALNA